MILFPSFIYLNPKSMFNQYNLFMNTKIKIMNMEAIIKKY